MATVSYLIALASVAVMGFANQRGGICSVAAVEEIVAERKFGRLLALFEASLWVGGGLFLLNFVGRLPVIPAGYAVGPATILGGGLFGLGAFLNGACLFGTVARLGSGEWAYAATPLGFYLGSLMTWGLHGPAHSQEKSLILTGSSWVALAILILLAGRLLSHGRAIQRNNRTILAHAWSPHVATTIIGITFLVALVTAGDWTYSEFLRDLAHGVTSSWAAKSLLYLSLLAGAVFGGWTGGRLKHTAPDIPGVLRRLGGGVMMGAGGALIPGGNTGLVLIGMPLLLSYAWLAFTAICVTVYLAIRITASTSSPP
jgi:uncharacterized membrane protein YedE/YeeE